MRKPNGRELKALFVLSIAAPVGILISLRLTGILQEPPTLETTTAGKATWHPHLRRNLHAKNRSLNL